MASAQQAKEFIKTIAPIVMEVCARRGYGDVQAYTCIAQACCESNYGTAALMKNANAFFGIKATSKWVHTAKYGGKVYNTRTKECYDGKTYTNITAAFRAYNSMKDSIEDYFDLMASRYSLSLAALTVSQCITAIKNGGYATSPTYVSTILSIYKKYESLFKQYHVYAPATPEQVVGYKTVTPAVVKAVIAGKYGNGSTRTRKLTEAGYDPKAVQLAVNTYLMHK